MSIWLALTLIWKNYQNTNFRVRLYARYLCSRDALDLKAEPVGQARRATIGYLVYKELGCDNYKLV